MPNTSSIENFRKNVVDKYTIYNSLFAALPFSGVANAGALLPIFLQACINGYNAGKSPVQITNEFFGQHTSAVTEHDKTDRMFKFVQYIERQIVLFDSIEDSAFTSVNNMEGAGSLKALLNEAAFAGKTNDLKNKLRSFRTRVVLTAHPTQFYPGSVLGIIYDMAQALGKNDFNTINQYIQQLGITPFFNKKQPTPFDEAENLMWYLEHILYHSIGNIYNYIQKEIFENEYDGDNVFIELGFWPGGDRDGNPFVDTATTLKVARALRGATIACYYRDVRTLKRRLTFSGVDKILARLEMQLWENMTNTGKYSDVNKADLLSMLQKIRSMIVEDHHSLYIDRLDSLINKVKIFGTHFASIDIRQTSSVHTKALSEINLVLKEKGEEAILPDDYDSLEEEQKINILAGLERKIDPSLFDHVITRDTLESMAAIKQIQTLNGEVGCHRYVISNCSSALNVMEVYALLRLSGWQKDALSVDIVPLFETVDDLKDAEAIMEQLYTHPVYRNHLSYRNMHQTVMVGFSDGTKDGGYLQANWSIYKAKETLTAISRKNDIVVKFFDGRGGPPSRGGGKSNQFYASMGSNIENEEIQLTIQGQTITSNFGTIESSQFNLEQLLNAGLKNELFATSGAQLSEKNRNLMEKLATTSYKAYQDFKAHPLFLPYLQQLSPLNYYSKTNIASRPAKRGGSDELKFEDLRAIPFVGSWSQIKQNVPGFYGLGTALKQAKDEGLWNDVKALYNEVLFFRTLIENSMMSMLKSFFDLTNYISEDEKFGGFWKLIRNEFEQTRQLVLELAGFQELMETDKAGRASILLRDKIVLPLLTIQQYALYHLHNNEKAPNEMKEVYERLVTRSMFGIINAARNSA